MDFEKDIDQCLKVLKEGGLILYPTDTVWGIGCDATNVEAVQRVYAVKRRPEKKAMIVLVSDEKDVLQYTAAPDLAVFDHLQKITKPTTVIYDGAIGLASNLVAEDGSIAIRICNDVFCKHLIKRFRKPIVSSSANISGEPTARIYSEISDEIIRAVDYVVTHRQDDRSVAEPSAVIRWHNGEVQFLRP